ncbi:uncharacterized protein LOC129798724 [Phlebotomus papatasi]|uniref:uncharacterized protein LOC129798724 n=1 Tax=Phlebotomus papatasi TaxID=29031 RepID=UPI002483696B|nr:uncharacterized protein LOC129798724 [Phlebotomus papatasi]
MNATVEAEVLMGNFFFENFSLKKLMDQSISGRMVMKNYQNTNFLEKTDQNVVAAIIIDNHLKYSSHVSVRDFKRYSAEIKQLFPSENEDLYYKPPAPKSKSNPTGKLYGRFKNMSAKYRKILPKPAENSSPNDNLVEEEGSAVVSALQETSGK